MDKKVITAEIDKLMEESHFHFTIYGFDEAEKLIKKAINLAIKHDLKEKIVDGLGELGYYQVKEIGNYELAIECYKDCIDILKGLENKNKEIGYYYYRLGRIYYNEDWKLQIKYHLKALEHHDFDDNYITHYRIHNELGLAYQSIQEYDSAIESFLTSVDIHSKALPKEKTEEQWSCALKELSTTYLAKGDLKKSEEYKLRYDRALKGRRKR